MDKKEFDDALANINNSFTLSKERIGATNTAWKLLRKELMDISKKFDSGAPISSIEIQKLRRSWFSEDPLIDENGNPFVFYIHDFSNSAYGTPNRVFHVAWCHTLDTMERGGRRERYVKKTDLGNNDFKVDYGNNTKGVERLPACYNCEKKMKNKVAPTILYYNRNNLDIVKFFELYGKQDLKNMDNPMYAVGYPDNWNQISKKLRDESGWVCSSCHRSFLGDKTGLDVHHKNGVKSDIGSSNLIVLCRDCHTKQFGHGHMKVLGTLGGQNNNARSEQKIPSGLFSNSMNNKLENFLKQPERYATGSEKANQKVKDMQNYFESMKHNLTAEKQERFYTAINIYKKNL